MSESHSAILFFVNSGAASAALMVSVVKARFNYESRQCRREGRLVPPYQHYILICGGSVQGLRGNGIERGGWFRPRRCRDCRLGLHHILIPSLKVLYKGHEDFTVADLSKDY